MMKKIQFLAAIVAVAASLFSQARAQDDSQLAKKMQNPVADLISVRCRAISTSALAPETKMIYLLNVQPVIPIKIADD